MTRSDKFAWEKSLRGADLTHGEFRVLIMLGTYANQEGERAHPGSTRLAKDCGMTRRGVQLALQSLIAKDMIVQVVEGGNLYGKGTASLYTINLPSPRANVGSPFKGESERGKGEQNSSKGERNSTPRANVGSPHQISTSDQYINSDPDGSGALRSEARAAHDDEEVDIETIVWQIACRLGEDLDEEEQRRAEAMLQKGTHPNAVYNMIRKARSDPWSETPQRQQRGAR